MLCLYTGDLLRLVMMMVNPGLNVVDGSPIPTATATATA